MNRRDWRERDSEENNVRGLNTNHFRFFERRRAQLTETPTATDSQDFGLDE